METVDSAPLNVQTSLGNVEIYVDPNSWAHLFLLGDDGEAMREGQDLIETVHDLARCFAALGIAESEAARLAHHVISQIPESHPSVANRLRRLAFKVTEALSDTTWPDAT